MGVEQRDGGGEERGALCELTSPGMTSPRGSRRVDASPRIGDSARAACTAAAAEGASAVGARDVDGAITESRTRR